MQAVGRRYSGSFAATVPQSEPQLSRLGIPVTVPGTHDAIPGQESTLPRVNYWGLWNEPNEGAWLNPQWRPGTGGGRIPVAPALPRGLVDASWRGLAASGHRTDTILIGETASGGITRPNEFVRALYCVDTAYRPLTGSAARAISCPASGDRASFLAAHPGQFGATGYAHHPYSYDRPPGVPRADPALVTIANLHSFEHALDRTFSAYGQPGGLPIYLTEFGYRTRPPNPFVSTTLAQQAA